MTAAIPRDKPKMRRDEVLALLTARHPALDAAAALAEAGVLIVGIRGYYRDGMGEAGKNDRRIYDDALFVVTRDGMTAWNGNTDPNGYRPGKGTGAGKGMAVLKPGVWRAYKLDKHKQQYLAVCQRAAKVTVIRDGTPPYPETGMFGINIHKGGINGTSSEGCQTIPPAQWPGFIGAVVRDAEAGAVMTYVLLEGV